MATLHCNSLFLNKISHPIPRHSFNPLFSSAGFIPNLSTSISTTSTVFIPKISILACNASADNAPVSNFSVTDSYKLTYLEGNSWLWNVGGANILVDPILVGNLDFGIPWLYDASKKFLNNFQCSLVIFLKLIAYSLLKALMITAI
ncbi:hypothetical protein KIW84_022515 [Lathyrus oleraceus]|uniref:Uncharacterized protein n=1 Tax=Pisum sativum TaxID=3888 RepID=A0A9D4YCQ0_PEA|nr:hypothetical protein KIW84_022515 [Pisum sativum]